MPPQQAASPSRAMGHVDFQGVLYYGCAGTGEAQGVLWMALRAQ